MNYFNQNQMMTNLREKASRFVMIGAVATSVGLLSLTGISYADDGMNPAGHSGHMMAMHDPANMEKHLDRMLDHLVPDLSPAQKTSIKAIATAAATDMKAFHEQRKALHLAQITILSAATVDRTALEQNRTEEMRLTEQMTKRKNLALADTADVLTAAQRAKAGETLKARLDRKIQPGTMKSPFSH
ncbi:MAG: periplasmic heavy metal sensor [Burkholderiales bacterium]|nr:periplasmic heavy metal sensor [Burkholderiales bacterium]